MRRRRGGGGREGSGEGREGSGEGRGGEGRGGGEAGRYDIACLHVADQSFLYIFLCSSLKQLLIQIPVREEVVRTSPDLLDWR